MQTVCEETKDLLLGRLQSGTVIAAQSLWSSFPERVLGSTCYSDEINNSDTLLF